MTMFEQMCQHVDQDFPPSVLTLRNNKVSALPIGSLCQDGVEITNGFRHFR